MPTELEPPEASGSLVPPKGAVMAVNTLSVTASNEGTKTMLQRLLPALRQVAPEYRQLLICSHANRHLFDHGDEIIEIDLDDGQKLRRIACDQFRVPKLVKSRAHVLLSPVGVGSLHTSMPQIVIVSSHLALPSCNRDAGDDGYSGLHRIYYGAPFRWALRKADAVIGISQFVADGLVSELGIDPEKVSAMPLGVAPPDTAPSLARREPVILFVGTLYGYKDALVLVRAFAQARARLPQQARLVVAGKDHDGQIAALRVAAADAGAQDAVDLTGPVSSEQLDNLYSRASVLVLPSRCEGFGLPVAEAMSRGVPVVVANATSLPELAGDAGILVERGDAAGFADALVEVLTDPRRHREMAERGLARIRDLTWEESARRLRAVLDTVLSRAQ
jgi:glycosyltransferase involved in cell wall biosynthesis